jgi:hypothetical protein
MSLIYFHDTRLPSLFEPSLHYMDEPAKKFVLSSMASEQVHKGRYRNPPHRNRSSTCVRTHPGVTTVGGHLSKETQGGFMIDVR